MHVEFRISCIERICAFDAESFIRMHQLRDRSLLELEPKRALVTLPEGDRRARRSFQPHLKIQLVFENLVCIESSIFCGEAERQQHEKQVTTNWDASEIRTKRYCSYTGEVIVASLPISVTKRHLKIRLVQLVPELSREEYAFLKASYPSFFNMQDNSLCIGVAKIGMRELLITNGGVSVKLQPKQGMMSAVEARNLNTIATNGMFGRDVGGSAVLTLQTASVIFGEKSLLPWFTFSRRSTGATPACPLSTVAQGVGGTVDVHGSAETNGGEERVAELRQQMSSPVSHFLLVPYMVFIHTVLCLSDAVSWRHTTRTALLFCIVMFVFLTDVLEMGLMLGFLVEVISITRMAVFFYRMPSRMDRSVDSVISLAKRGDDFQAVLYGCQNHVINGMVRARLFFSQGLLADCYFELAFLFSRMLRAKRWLLPCVMSTITASLVFSTETLLLLLLLAAFLIHPLTLRVPPSHLRKLWRRQMSLGVFWQVLKLCRPMRVSRVVLVTEERERKRLRMGSLSTTPFISPSPMRSLITFPAPAIPQQTALEENRHHRTASVNASAERESGQSRQAGDHASLSRMNPQASRLLSNSAAVDKSSLGTAMNSNNHLAAHLSSSKVFSRSVGDTLRLDAQTKLLLNFALIVITTEGAPVNGNKMAISGSGGNGLIVQKFRRILQRARALERPPPPELQREQYQAYFNCVIPFLQFLRRQCTLKVYVTPSSSLSSLPTLDTGKMLRLDHLANLSHLVDEGEDDGITSTLLAHSSQQVLVGQLPPLEHIDTSARAFAVLAAYLLQGSRLSIYSRPGNKGCGTIIPLKMGSNDIELAPEPNPCPPSLQKALIDIWKGWTDEDVSIFINTDVVMNIISTQKEFLGGDGSDGLCANEDYQNIIMASQDGCKTARETSKRLFSTFSALSLGSKRQRALNASFQNPEDSFVFSTLGGKGTSKEGVSPVDGEKPHKTTSVLPAGNRTFHQATRSWAYSPPTFDIMIPRQLSVPRNGLENTYTWEEGLGRSSNEGTKTGTEDVSPVGAMSGTSRAK
ncbi:hypothetical protein C4B63_306g11 [Trypanosoma cruzi]|uniref:Uncharacterized protein n=1 Tax=Trypanosoma cruzi TaxID=5693 RepID=A0A2V2UHX0_TRYCR|nr:hypothetical protein C4B63_306g11 [Trypanosoma cruzi]